MKAHHHLIVPMSLSISLLDSLTQQLNEREVTFVRGSLVHAFEMGKLLAQAKQEVKKQHILWKVYLKDSVPGVSARTARLYVQVFTHWGYLSEVATVATNATLSLKDAQVALNAVASKKTKSRNINFIANLENSLQKTEVSLDEFLETDWNDCDCEALSNLLNTLATLESRIARTRTKLSNRLLSQSGSCPGCHNDLIQGMESCLCGWNVGELPFRDCWNL